MITIDSLRNAYARCFKNGGQLKQFFQNSGKVSYVQRPRPADGKSWKQILDDAMKYDRDFAAEILANVFKGDNEEDKNYAMGFVKSNAARLPFGKRQDFYNKIGYSDPETQYEGWLGRVGWGTGTKRVDNDKKLLEDILANGTDQQYKAVVNYINSNNTYDNAWKGEMREKYARDFGESGVTQDNSSRSDKVIGNVKTSPVENGEGNETKTGNRPVGGNASQVGDGQASMVGNSVLGGQNRPVISAETRDIPDISGYQPAIEDVITNVGNEIESNLDNVDYNQQLADDLKNSQELNDWLSPENVKAYSENPNANKSMVEVLNKMLEEKGLGSSNEVGKVGGGSAGSNSEGGGSGRATQEQRDKINRDYYNYMMNKIREEALAPVEFEPDTFDYDSLYNETNPEVELDESEYAVSPEDTDYNNLYHNASRKGLRQFARGKDNSYLGNTLSGSQRRQMARGIRQGRREDARNYLDTGEYNYEWKTAPEYQKAGWEDRSAERRGEREKRNNARGIMNGRYPSQRNGGAMMRTFIGAMRRGGRL